MNIASSQLMEAAVVFLFSIVFFFYILKPYRGLTRYSNFIEMWRLFVSLAFSSVLLYLYILLLNYKFDYRYFFVQNAFLISLALLLFMRYCIVYVYNYTMNYTTEIRNKSLIYEIDTHSIALEQWLNKSASNQYQVKGFITRVKNARKTRIQDLPVHILNGDNLD